MNETASGRLDGVLGWGAALLALALVGCASAASSPSPAGGGGSAGGGGTSDCPDGLCIDLGGMSGGGGRAGGGGGGAVLDPWRYYDEDKEHGYKDAALPDDVRTQFGGAPAASGKPTLTYPLNGSLHAKNLARITFQWTQGSATNTVFRIEATASDQKYALFVPCKNAQCSYQLPTDEWLTLGKEYGGKGPLTFRISGTDGKGGAVGTSEAVALQFSPEDVHGALYYWAANSGTIKRATFGAQAAVPFIAPGSTTNEFQCAGCHSVSRDGSTIAFAVSALEGEDRAAIQTAPTQNPASPYVRPGKSGDQPTNFQGHNVALSPDGMLAAVNGIPATGEAWPPYFEIRETRTGKSLVKLDMGDPLFGEEHVAILPEWSPDGRSLAVTLADGREDGDGFGCLWTAETCRSSIAVMSYSGGVLGAAQVLVRGSGAEYHFYPTWSPDGRYIAFASARFDKKVKNEGGDPQQSESNPDAVLRIVRATGGPYTCPSADCSDLVNGMQYSVADALAHKGKQSTWPKFTPFTQGADDSLAFISLNSKIDYGFPRVDDEGLARSQLWMFGLDLKKVGQGDPSFAPVWLPYQDIEDSNLTPYWTETLPCAADPSGACAGCTSGEKCVVDLATDACHCESSGPS